MGRGRNFLERLAGESDIAMESFPGQPILELAGDSRVLIENHNGVKAYGREKILVRVKYGYVCVCGCGLELHRMTKDQLVIRGKIDAISVQRRE